MESTIHKNEHGEWVVTVGRWVIARKESEREAQELQEVLLRPGMFLDTTQDDIDLIEPDGSAKSPYPLKE
jgi:hypothetical protein